MSIRAVRMPAACNGSRALSSRKRAAPTTSCSLASASATGRATSLVTPVTRYRAMSPPQIRRPVRSYASAIARRSSVLRWRSRAQLGSAAVADEAFLHDRADPPTVLGGDPTCTQTTGPTGPWRVLVVEQPAVGAELGVEPHRVVEARDEHLAVGEVDAVGEQDRVEQRHVARVGEHADMQ